MIIDEAQDLSALYVKAIGAFTSTVVPWRSCWETWAAASTSTAVQAS